jgi:hypothetical protein
MKFSNLRKARPSPAVVVASLALVVAAAPPAYAALAANSVGTVQIKDGAVTTPKLRGSAVTSPKVKDGSLKLADLTTTARVDRIMTGHWTRNQGYVEALSSTPKALGSLSSGTGALVVTARSTLVVDGMVYLQNSSPNTVAPNCQLKLNGTNFGFRTLSYLPSFSGAQMALASAADVPPGTHDVALECTGSNATAGNIWVNVTALPR